MLGVCELLDPHADQADERERKARREAGLCGVIEFVREWQRHSSSYFQLDPACTLHIQPGRGCFFSGVTFLLSQLGHFGSSSSSLTRNARPQSLHPYSLPYIFFHLLEYLLFFFAGILPAGIHSGLHPKLGQHVPVQNEPANDDRNQYKHIVHSDSSFFIGAPCDRGPPYYTTFSLFKRNEA